MGIYRPDSVPQGAGPEMLKILCRALGHRLRVVQEFSPFARRVKCVRCGGDWAMDDNQRIFLPWHSGLEQFHRDFGFEVLEPMPTPPPPVEPLTFSEEFRACRWPTAIAITLGSIVSHTIQAAGFRNVGLIAVFAVTWGIGYFLARWAIDRAYERKRNSLQA